MKTWNSRTVTPVVSLSIPGRNQNSIWIDLLGPVQKDVPYMPTVMTV